MQSEQLTLSDIAATLKRQKRIVFFSIAVTTLVGVAYATHTRPQYVATVTVKPEEEGASGIGGLAQQLSPAAGLAGIDLAGASSDKDEYIAILRSRELSARFVDQYDLKRHLFHKRWNEEEKRWRDANSGLLTNIRMSIKSALAKLSGDQGWKPKQPIPSDWETFKLLNDSIISIEEDLQTGLLSVSFQFRDPELAAQWANAYVAMANQEIRDNTIFEASRALSYLKEEAEKTTVSGLRESIFSLVEHQLERIMLANSRPQYAFKVLDKAVIPEEPDHPKRVLVIIISIFLGSILGMLLALVADIRQGKGENIAG